MENLDKWKKAGKIAAQAREYAKDLVKKGAVIREVCDKIDAKIIELGAKPARPTQVGLNQVAAHWTPDHDDDRKFEDEVVCVDIGAHIDGCIGDNAFSVDLSGKHENILLAAKEALENAAKILRPGVTMNEIGQTIHDSIRKHDAVPVKNLSGHGISEYDIHDLPSVPNYPNGDDTELEEGEIIAIEPFATDGLGFVDEMEQGNLFSLEQTKPVRSQFAREIMKYVDEEYGPMVFCSRWLVRKFGTGKTNLAIRELVRVGNLHTYPPLVERAQGKVAQFENTFLITKEGAEVLTRVN